MSDAELEIRNFVYEAFSHNPEGGPPSLVMGDALEKWCHDVIETCLRLYPDIQLPEGFDWLQPSPK